MPSEAYADVTNAALREEIENSLLGQQEEVAEARPEEEAYFGDSDALDLLNSAVEDQDHDTFRLGDAVAQERARSGEQAESPVKDSQRQRSPEDWDERILSREDVQELTAQPEQPALPSPSEALEKYGLNDAESNRHLATEWSSAFGMTVEEFSKVDSEKVGRAISEMGLAAIESFIAANGDLSKIAGAVPAQTANQFMHQVLSGMGENPQFIPGDRQAASGVLWGAMLNIIRTHAQTGATDPQVLNQPEVAEFYFGEYLKAHGIDPSKLPNLREMSVRAANALTQHVIGMIERRAQAGQRMQQSSRGSRKASRAPRIPGGRVRGMNSNQDLFDKSTLNAWRQQHGRL